MKYVFYTSIFLSMLSITNLEAADNKCIILGMNKMHFSIPKLTDLFIKKADNLDLHFITVSKNTICYKPKDTEIVYDLTWQAIKELFPDNEVYSFSPLVTDKFLELLEEASIQYNIKRKDGTAIIRWYNADKKIVDALYLKAAQIVFSKDEETATKRSMGSDSIDSKNQHR